jgi:hypothetical protein
MNMNDEFQSGRKRPWSASHCFKSWLKVCENTWSGHLRPNIKIVLPEEILCGEKKEAFTLEGQTAGRTPWITQRGNYYPVPVGCYRHSRWQPKSDRRRENVGQPDSVADAVLVVTLTLFDGTLHSLRNSVRNWPSLLRVQLHRSITFSYFPSVSYSQFIHSTFLTELSDILVPATSGLCPCTYQDMTYHYERSYKNVPLSCLRADCFKAER